MTRELIARAPESALNERTIAITGIDTDELLENIRDKGMEYGSAKNAIDHVERMRKVKIAQLKEKHRAEIAKRNQGKDKADREKDTDGRLEDLARSDGEYIQFLQEQNKAEEAFNPIENDFFHERRKYDLLLEQMKLARAEMHYLQQSSTTL